MDEALMAGPRFPVPRFASSALPLSILAVLCLGAGEARSFRIIASSSGNAGIAQAPCCGTSFDGGYESSTAAYTGTPLAPNVLEAGGSVSFDVPRTDAGTTTVTLSGAAQASLFDIGTVTSIEITNWDAAFTGESIESSASARLEQVFTVDSLEDLYVLPVFHLEGSMAYADGISSSVHLYLQGSGFAGTAFLKDAGPVGTSESFDEQVVGPAFALSSGGSLFLSIQLSSLVTANVNDVGAGDQIARADALNTLTLLGFEVYTDAALTERANVDFTSDSGETFATVPEPGTALLWALGLTGLGLAARRRTSRGSARGWARAAPDSVLGRREAGAGRAPAGRETTRREHRRPDGRARHGEGLPAGIVVAAHETLHVTLAACTSAPR